MVSVQVLHLLAVASAVSATAGYLTHLVVAPQSPVLEIGTNFTATCNIINTIEMTADDLYWNLSKTTVPKEQYTKVNQSALSVTIPVTGETAEWLFCHGKSASPYFNMKNGQFVHGISLTKGYRPEKPENLSCMVVQEGQYLSTTFRCQWSAVRRQTVDVPTSFTLTVSIVNHHTFNVTTHENKAEVEFVDSYPNHMPMDIWVEAHNKLGRIQSEHLQESANCFVKTNPPSDVKVIAEKSFPTSLLINWTHPIAKEYVKLTYRIRFCSSGSHNWTYVPLADTDMDIQSFRLQNLRPDTTYITQVSCKYFRGGFWSNWSSNATMRTPEDQPASKADVWRIINEGDGINERKVQFITKDPVLANGRITRFDIKIWELNDKIKDGGSEWEGVNRSDNGSVTFLKEIDLIDKKSVKISVRAVNSVGKSVVSSLLVPAKSHERAPVEELKVWPREGQLWLQWNPPSDQAVTEYVVEWITGDQTDWQRENRTTRFTTIRGNLEKFVCYNVSVYPVYSSLLGKPTSVDTFLEQGAPLEAPAVSLNGKPGRNEAELVWNEIPISSRRGFITNYTIFYSNGDQEHGVTVPAGTTSYTLKSLLGNTQYITWIRASTIRGSANGMKYTFITLKYAPGEMESIVVGVSLGFLFVVVMTMVLCVYKKDVIKENFWPQIPNPGESTIGSWSPDAPLKTETPKENCLSGISVLDVDVCDAKCVFEEDKASLPLKKDKYLSEEHSSGIGGSSCMSSPRQSVSDSDEDGDMADTTASTVQYSSVVASSGYKGQTPNPQPQQAVFSRSESTQPLLDSEENPDMMLQEASRPSRCLNLAAGNEDSSMQLLTEQQEVLEHLDFCPLEEDTEPSVPTGPVSSYMPQLGGYRPQ